MAVVDDDSDVAHSWQLGEFGLRRLLEDGCHETAGLGDAEGDTNARAFSGSVLDLYSPDQPE